MACTTTALQLVYSTVQCASMSRNHFLRLLLLLLLGYKSKFTIMKLLSIGALLLLNISILFAENIKVDAVNRTMSQGEQPGFSVVLPKADVKSVEENWAATVQGRSKAKAVKENNEWVIKGIVVPQITQDTLDIYARTISTTEGVVFEAFFKDKDGFIGSDRSLIHPQAEKFVHDFAIKQHKQTLENQLDAAKEVLKNFEKDYSSLSKDLEKLQSEITKSKLKIDDNKNKVNTNDADQDRVRSQIQSQKQKVVDAAKLSPEAKKAEEKNLSTLEKDLSKLIKDKEKLLQDNVKCESSIRDAELEIKNKNVEIEAKQKQIAEQKGKIKELEDQIRSLK